MPEPPVPEVARRSDDDEMGEPIAELKDLSLDVDAGFSRRVRGRIERRVLAGEFVWIAWLAPAMVFLELLRAPFELFAAKRRDPD